MNQHAYKLVFNQKRGMLVAVSEVAVNHSKEPNSGQTQGSSGHTGGVAQGVRRAGIHAMPAANAAAALAGVDFSGALIWYHSGRSSIICGSTLVKE